MALDSIVSVSIQVGTSQPSQRGFGTPLILAYHTRFLDNVRTYSRLSEMVSDGFTVNDPAYLMAAKIFAQNPRPPEVKVGRLPAPGSAHTTEIDVAGLVSGESVTMTVRDAAGNTTDVSEPFDTSDTTTATNLAATIDAISGMSASAASTVVTVVADSNGPVVFFEDVTNAAVLDVTGDWAYDTQLTAIADEDSDFYVVLIDVNSAANVADVAAWAASTERLALFGPQSTDPADYNTAAADALTSGTNDNAASLVTQHGRSAFPECAWAGEVLPWPAGSQTWAYKQPGGLVADAWTSSDITELDTTNSNYAARVAGLTLVREGKTHGGEYLDVVRGLAWLKARIQERILARLANLRKVPMTDSGIEIVKSAVDSVLLEGEARGLLTPGSSLVTAPAAADISAADRAARRLTGVEFSCQLAGAVHEVEIQGDVTV